MHIAVEYAQALSGSEPFRRSNDGTSFALLVRVLPGNPGWPARGGLQIQQGAGAAGLSGGGSGSAAPSRGPGRAAVARLAGPGSPQQPALRALQSPPGN